jgi:hypothetical protein
MTQPRSYEDLLQTLGGLHRAALKDSEPLSNDARAAARDRLAEAIQVAKQKARTSSVESSPGFLKRHLAWAMALPMAGLAAAVVALLLRPPVRVEIHPEPTVRAHTAGVDSALAKATTPTWDPCERAPRALGKRPLIDDFEDQNPLIASQEGRVALWSLFKDTDSPGGSLTLLPEARPQATRVNRFALHAQGDELRNWGAVIQISFSPSCYDASAYDGITFSARGPGRVYAGAREVRVVPPEYGGTCSKDCYNAHQKKVELTSQWRTYTILWNEMVQRGYDMPALDPARINSLAFSILPGDTPFDVWIDDMKFVTKR